jgi:hypothetical protein
VRVNDVAGSADAVRGFAAVAGAMPGRAGT